MFWTAGQRVHWDTLAVGTVLIVMGSSDMCQWVVEEGHRPMEGRGIYISTVIQT